MANTNHSLEIRINSINDAKSVVRYSGKIAEAVARLGLDSIEFLVANEIKQEVNALIRGPIFKVKTFTSYVSPREGNTLFDLPHFAVSPGVPKPLVEPPQPPQPQAAIVEVKSLPGKRTLNRIKAASARA